MGKHDLECDNNTVTGRFTEERGDTCYIYEKRACSKHGEDMGLVLTGTIPIDKEK